MAAIEIHPKGWGYEKWIVNKDEYCGKLLHIIKGMKCSWHYHKKKDETFYLQEGKLLVKYSEEDDIEKELAELENTEPELEEQPAPGRAVPKKAKEKTRNEKIKLLLAMKAIELTKQLEKEVSLEQNMIIQRQLLALISYVPGFDYNEKENLDLANFYPPKPTVDHAFARWFLNDPNFGAMEDLQYQ